MKAVNLIPAEQRGGGGVGVGAGRSEGAAYAVLALVAGLAVMALLYGIAHHQISSRRAEAASFTAKAQQAQNEATKLSSYTTFLTLREQREQAVTTLIDTRFDWAHALHEFGRVLPSSISVASLGGSIGSTGSSVSATPAAPTATTTTATTSSSVTSATPAGSVPTFSVTGCATNQRAVAMMLERLRLIDGVNEVALQSSATASGASTGSSSGGCTNGQASYSAAVTFEGLPTPSTTSTKATTSSSASSGAAATTTTTGAQ
jgi:Tfp pilus assembly protein PilN